MALRNFEAADKTIDRVIAASPQSFQATCIERIRGGSNGKAILAWPKKYFLQSRLKPIRMV